MNELVGLSLGPVAQRTYEILVYLFFFGVLYGQASERTRPWRWGERLPGADAKPLPPGGGSRACTRAASPPSFRWSASARTAGPGQRPGPPRRKKPGTDSDGCARRSVFYPASSLTPACFTAYQIYVLIFALVALPLSMLELTQQVRPCAYVYARRCHARVNAL
jgi:hypothetical protein